MKRKPSLALAALAFVLGFTCPNSHAAEPADLSTTFDTSAIEFFEKSVRPLLISRCQKCHGPEKQKGGLRLDSRQAVLQGGDSGPALVIGKPTESRLIAAIKYSDEVKMPPNSKLPEAEVAILSKWVSINAPWPVSETKASPDASLLADMMKQRAKHWSLQPINSPKPPRNKDQSWPKNDIDRFLLSALESNHLKPAPDTDRRSWIRRATFDLTGLPPTPADVEAFVADRSEAAYPKVVDRLLNSPHYGERWGRHWLDLVRYAETSGHEFDYEIPDAWRYRDYVIRAMNADIPYNQFITEQIAGDLLPNPRRNPVDGTNESILGTGFYFLVEGTHSPVDIREEEAFRIDNQIDVFAKSFLGLTVSCAKCHDHKFDAITTKDYYALSGYLKSSRHDHVLIDTNQDRAKTIQELTAIKNQIATWLKDHGAITSTSLPTIAKDESVLFADFPSGSMKDWFVTGEAFGSGPTGNQEFKIVTKGDKTVAEPLPAGVAHSGRISTRLQGTLRSPTFTITHPFIHCLVKGQSTRINVVIDGFEKIKDPIYGGLVKSLNSPDGYRWQSINVDMWKGHKAYIEFGDGSTVDYTGSTTRYSDGEHDVAIAQIRFSNQAAAPQLKDPQPSPSISLNDPVLKDKLARFRSLEASLKPPGFAPAIAEGTPQDDHVHIRGNPRAMGELVPRRFLEVLNSQTSHGQTSSSSRLDLANHVTDPNNPLTARVIVNRVWKHHFGEGLVRSTDDFGAMGQAPSHPELLDWLAKEFVAKGWSLKSLHRMIMLSHAYQMTSDAQPEADKVDPNNRLLHRMNTRRMEAESIRDSILSVSGRLDTTMFGPSVPTHLTPYMEGRGRPGASGPLDGAGRRSIYLNVRRNFLSPLLLVFDFPTPSTCIGRRNVSNVPAQALTLLNDPLVLEQASLWAKRVTNNHPDLKRRIRALYESAYSRDPLPEETAAAEHFLLAQTGGPANPQSWVDLCHALINTKEFLFIP
jgi:hypothetical protein